MDIEIQGTHDTAEGEVRGFAEQLNMSMAEASKRILRIQVEVHLLV